MKKGTGIKSVCPHCQREFKKLGLQRHINVAVNFEKWLSAQRKVKPEEVKHLK